MQFDEYRSVKSLVAFLKERTDDIDRFQIVADYLTRDDGSLSAASGYVELCAGRRIGFTAATGEELVNGDEMHRGGVPIRVAHDPLPVALEEPFISADALRLLMKELPHLVKTIHLCVNEVALTGNGVTVLASAYLMRCNGRAWTCPVDHLEALLNDGVLSRMRIPVRLVFDLCPPSATGTGVVPVAGLDDETL